MPSTIDTSGIDVDYPVAGEDNDSQGFRTNFTEIKAALDAATSDINTLFVTGGYAGSVGTQGPLGYTGSTSVGGGGGYTGSQGDPGSPGGYTGSASTIIGYTGSTSVGGGGGYTGSQGDPGSPGGYTGSASTELGYTGSQGEVGFTGSSAGGGVTWSYQTSSFSATAGSYYFLDPGAPITMTLPVPTTGDVIIVRGYNLDVNNLTINDDTATLVTTIDTYSCDILLRYSGAVWAIQKNGTINANMPVTSRAVAVFNDTYGDVLLSTAVTIGVDGNVTIPAPTDTVMGSLSVDSFVGYTGSNTASSRPAIVSNGSAYTTSLSVTSASGVLDIDCGLSNVFYTTLTESISNLNLNNPSNGQTINVLFKQGTGGNFTMNWGTVSNGLKWPIAAEEPPLSTFAGQRDMFVATYIDMGGGDARWYCTLTNDFTSPA